MAKKLYVWDEERGVVKDDRQFLQLLVGPAPYSVRRKCGLLLVNALNAASKRKRSN